MSHLQLPFNPPGSLSSTLPGLPTPASSAPIDRASQIGIGGRAFLLANREDRPYIRNSAKALRDQFDTSEEAGEHSFGDIWWRRSQSDFSSGAGQLWVDRKNSNEQRFYSSKGIDVFSSAPEIKLQKDVALSRTSANTNLFCLQAGDTTSYVYVADGSIVLFTTDPYAVTPTYTDSDIWGAETNEAVLSITSSGQHIYATGAVNGIHRGTYGSTSGSHYSDLLADLIRWCKQRLMAAKGPSIYEVIAAGAAPAAAFTHALTTWVWTDFTEIGPAILASGWSGEKSTVYGATIQQDGTLGVWREVTEGGLPDGEIIRCMNSYLGFVFLGTNKGVRVATHDAEGNLTYGPLVPVDVTVDVRCFEPQDVYMWFGWTNLDSSSTGLGRLDLRTFTATLRPAYASDLMATTQGNVLGVCTHSSKRVFAVSAHGFYAEKTTYVTTGTLTTSKIGFGTTIDKIAKILELDMQANSGSVAMSILDANDIVTSLGSTTEDFSETGARSTRSPAFSLRFTVTPLAGETASPMLRHYVLKALPGLRKGRVFQIPLRIFDYSENANHIKVGYPGKALDDLVFLETLEENADSVTYEDISSGIKSIRRSFDVVILDVQFRAQKTPEHATGYGGIVMLTMQTVT